MKTETYPGRAASAALRELTAAGAYAVERVGDVLSEARATVRGYVRFRESANVALADVEDWALVCATRVNVWLSGPPHTKRAALATIRPSLVEPVVTVRAGTALDVLPRSPSIATLIVEDVSALGLDDQRCLLAWLDEIGDGARVISLTSVPILPLIETGGFLESLYYRLNTVHVDLTPERKHPQ